MALRYVTLPRNYHPVKPILKGHATFPPGCRQFFFKLSPSPFPSLSEFWLFLVLNCHPFLVQFFSFVLLFFFDSSLLKKAIVIQFIPPILILSLPAMFDPYLSCLLFKQCCCWLISTKTETITSLLVPYAELLCFRSLQYIPSSDKRSPRDICFSSRKRR